jgi:type VI secretion system protein ImpH
MDRGFDLLEALRSEPHRFDFHQALRRVECAHADRPRLGTAARLTDDPVRLGQEAELTFAPATWTGLRAGASGAPWLVQRALGLFGPNGPLPLHLTEYARERARRHDDPTFARFVDMLQHRLLCLFHRAWADAEPTVHYDRPRTDRFVKYVGSLYGIGTPALRDRDAMPDTVKLHFAGRLASQARGAEGLEAILREFFHVDVRLEQFAGRWLEIPPEDRTRLGESRRTGTLGGGATLGARVWDRQSSFRVVLGPMSLDLYRRLLPDGEGLPALVAILHNYVGRELMWSVNLILRREEVPPLALGKSGQLGRTAWLCSRPLPRDADDLTLDPDTHDPVRMAA